MLTSPLRWSEVYACDGAVALLDSVAGVEPQTETVWRQADKYRVRIVYASKLDRVGADFDRCVDMVRERLDTTPVVLQRPYFTDGEFRGVADLVEMELRMGSDSVDSNFETGPIPDAFLEEANSLEKKCSMLCHTLMTTCLNSYSKMSPSNQTWSRQSFAGNTRVEYRTYALWFFV